MPFKRAHDGKTAAGFRLGIRRQVMALRFGTRRREWLWAGVAASLATAFGTLTSFAVAFLLPAERRPRSQRIFLGFASSFARGESRVFKLPSGERIVIANTGAEDPVAGIPFRGYSDRCPHLGCRVHYVGADGGYFCPCHNGVFDAHGVATAGPPAQAGQRLTPYELELDGNSLYAVVLA